MFNAIFVPSVRETEWVREMLPGISPAELPVAGKRFIDYAFERVQKLGVKFTEVLDWHFSEDLSRDFGDITRTGSPVFYMKGGTDGGGVPNGLDDLKKMVTPLTSQMADGLVVMWGLVLASHIPSDIRLAPVTEEECANTPPGLYRREGGRWMRILPHGIVVHNIVSWHRLNLAVMRNRTKFTLPGYSSEPDVHLGRNVVLEHGTNVKAPVLLQDNSWCARNVRLDGDVIVGKGSFIGEGACLKRTVVGDDTYVGIGLELTDKIVVGRRIFDGITNDWTDVEDPGLARPIDAFGMRWLHRLWKFLLGASRGRRR